MLLCCPGCHCERQDFIGEVAGAASLVGVGREVCCIGEYAERIDSADELLETFPEETSMVIGVGGAHLTGAATVYSSMQCALP
jgi:hypothetical protein